MIESIFPPSQLFSSRFPVLASRLHEGLRVKTELRHWISRRIEGNNLLEGLDFEFRSELTETPQVGRPSKEYALTLDAAKMIAMMESGEQGKIVRAYFLQCEQIAKSIATPSVVTQTPHQHALGIAQCYTQLGEYWSVPRHIVMIEASKEIRSVTGLDFTRLVQGSSAMETIEESDIMLEPTELAPYFGAKSGVQMNKILESAGLQTKTETGWEPTEDGLTMSMRHAWSRGDKSGYNLKWNKLKVQQWIAE
jgi:phage anti-repressor protein